MLAVTSDWGRIDETGTVFVRTADGEREIGSWQAGDTEVGLALYVRRFEDLQTEVSLLEQRLASGASDVSTTRTLAIELLAKIPSAAAIGDLASLEARLQEVLHAADAKAQEHAAARQAARAEAAAAKELLVTEAEQIAESSTSWKSSGDRLREIVDQWRLIRGVDRKTDDMLWKRFSAARDAFGKRRGEHFAVLDAERMRARSIKEQLVEEAEDLQDSTDWKSTASAMRELMTQWKAAPRASREVEDALWKQFRAAQDRFFSQRSSVFSERDAEQIANENSKLALVAEAEAIDITDPKAAQSVLRGIQVRFDAVGHVRREMVRQLEDRFKAAEQRVRNAADAQWRRSSADSNPFLVSLKERLAEAEDKLRKALKSGDADRIARAQAEVDQRRALIPE
jgi:hypothetical protein